MLAFSGRPTALVPRDGMGQAKPSPLALGVCVGGWGTGIAKILARSERPVEVGKEEGSPRLEVDLLLGQPLSVGTWCSSPWGVVWVVPNALFARGLCGHRDS